MRRIMETCDDSMSRKRRINGFHQCNGQITTRRKECLRARRSAQRDRKRSNYEEIEAVHGNPCQRMNKAIRCRKRQCWRKLLEEVKNDPWSRPYTVVMTRRKSQPMPSVTCPKHLQMIVMVLFLQQTELHQLTKQPKIKTFYPIMVGHLMEACGRVGNISSPVWMECPIPHGKQPSNRY